MGWRALFAAACVCALSTPAGAAPGTNRPARVWLEAQSRKVNRERSSLTQVARRAMPSVVSITTGAAKTEALAEDAEPQKGVGSGFIIHPDGYILTAAHVVESASDVTVTVLSPNGAPEELAAKVVGLDPRTDFALLKVDAGRKLPPLRLSSASRVDIADWVVVIGSPFGLAHSVTVGVVSYKGRADVTPNGRDGDFDYLQTDASINPGNSGGPVLDLNGEVVAIANAVNVAGQGIAFAIPADIAKAILPQLLAHGRVHRGWMGLAVQDLSPEVATHLGVANARGVVVTDVTEGGPAARAGLHTGDVIVGLGHQRVEKAQTLRWQVSTRGVGKNVHLRVQRSGQVRSVRLKLEASPGEDLPPPPASPPGKASPWALGSTVQDVLEP